DPRLRRGNAHRRNDGGTARHRARRQGALPRSLPMYAWQLAKMNHVAALNGWTPFVNMQCQYNLLYREEEREMLPYCHDQGIAVTTFSPLARGFLAREGGTPRTAHDLYQEYYGDDIDREIARRVREVAAHHGVTMAHVAMAWVAGNSNPN